MTSRQQPVSLNRQLVIHLASRTSDGMHSGSRINLYFGELLGRFLQLRTSPAPYVGPSYRPGVLGLTTSEAPPVISQDPLSLRLQCIYHLSASLSPRTPSSPRIVPDANSMFVPSILKRNKDTKISLTGRPDAERPCPAVASRPATTSSSEPRPSYTRVKRLGISYTQRCFESPLEPPPQGFLARRVRASLS
jgi:hypothetical protein